MAKPLKYSTMAISYLKACLNNFTATRYHSLVIEEKTLSEDFIVNARTVDGSIMGIQHCKLNVSGVQFHPESIMTEDGKKLLSNFLNTI